MTGSLLRNHTRRPRPIHSSQQQSAVMSPQRIRPIIVLFLVLMIMMHPGSGGVEAFQSIVTGSTITNAHRISGSRDYSDCTQSSSTLRIRRLALSFSLSSAANQKNERFAGWNLAMSRNDASNQNQDDSLAALRRALRNNQFASMPDGDPTYDNPYDVNSQVNTAASLQRDAQRLLQKLEQHEQQLQQEEEASDKETVQDSETVASTFDNDDSDADGVQLNSDEYLQLSQFVGTEDVTSYDRFTGGNDPYSKVLKKALSQQQNQSQKNNSMDQQRYKSILQNMAQPPPQSPNSFSQRQQQNQQQQQRPRGSPQQAPPQATVNDLMQAWQQRSMMKNETSEEVHQQVFESEQGFLKQSKKFRDSLSSTNAEAAEARREVMAKRHAAAYEARQSRAQERLQRQMEEFQDILSGKFNGDETSSCSTSSSKRVQCPMCQGIMTEEAWERSKRDYKGTEICDICYAEQWFAHGPNGRPAYDKSPPPMRQAWSRGKNWPQQHERTEMQPYWKQESSYRQDAGRRQVRNEPRSSEQRPRRSPNQQQPPPPKAVSTEHLSEDGRDIRDAPGMRRSRGRSANPRNDGTNNPSKQSKGGGDNMPDTTR